MQATRRRRLVAAGSVALLTVAGLGVWLAPVGNTAPRVRSHLIESVTEDYRDARGVEQGKGCKAGQVNENVSSPVRAGKAAFRHTVQDCGERAEVRGGRTAMGSTTWRGWSVQRPAGAAAGTTGKQWVIVNQWMSYPGPRTGTYPCDGNGHYIVSSQSGLSYRLQAPSSPGSQALRCREFQLASGAEVSGKWVDFVQHAKWTAGGDGFLKLWMRIGGDGRAWKVAIDYRGPTWPGDEDHGPFFKMGAYTGDPGRGNHVVLIDEYRLGDAGATFDDVAPGDDPSGPGGQPTAAPTPTPTATSSASPTSGPTAPVGTPVISEDFSSPTSAQRFATRGGTWGVVGGAYRLTAPASVATGNGNLAVHATRVSGDATVQAKLRVDASDSGWGDASLVFGYTDPANYFFLSLNQRDDANTSGLFRVAAGTLTQLADVTTPVQLARVHTARVDVTDGRVRAFLDGKPVAEAAVTVPAGQVGVGSRNNTLTADDLTVTAATGGFDPEPTGGPAPSGSPSSPGSPSPIGGPTATPTQGGPPPGPGIGPRCTGTLLDADLEAGNLSEFDGKEALDSELRVVPDPVGGSGKAVRVEVREDQRDQGGGRWRAEVVQEGAGGPNLQRDRCFEVSTYLPTDWNGTQPNILFQIHERPSACESWREPVLYLNVDEDSMDWAANYDSKACSGSKPQGKGRVASSPVIKGAWVHWVVRVRWSYGPDGITEVWQNGKQVGRYTGPNSYNDQEEYYLKVGNYVWGGFENTDRVVSYFDNVRMGTTITRG